MARMATPTLAPGSLAGVAAINGGEPVAAQLRITQERIDISTQGPKRDPNWTFTDTAGHFHARAEDGELPTLTARREHLPCDGSCGGVCGGEGYEITVHSCRICGEEIQPGTIPGPHYETMPGMVDWDLVVQQPLNGQGEVSVRFRTSDTAEFFGVAITGDVYMESGGLGGMRGRTTLHGVSQLGRRTVVPTV
jgi:hypothetical protein